MRGKKIQDMKHTFDQQGTFFLLPLGILCVKQLNQDVVLKSFC